MLNSARGVVAKISENLVDVDNFFPLNVSVKVFLLNVTMLGFGLPAILQPICASLYHVSK